MASIEVSGVRDVDESLRPGVVDGVVVKWLGGVVVCAGEDEVKSGVGDGGELGDGGRDAEGTDGVISDGVASRLTIRAAVGGEDRKGDVIDPKGWELDGYRRNPVFLWAHDRSRPPIGMSRRVWVDGVALYAEVEFAPTDFGLEVARLYEGGFMHGVSVGFLPLETELRRASNGRRGYLYRRQELLEISAVPVPMHADALSAGIPGSLGVAPDSLREMSELAELRDGLRRLRLFAEELVD